MKKERRPVWLNPDAKREGLSRQKSDKNQTKIRQLELHRSCWERKKREKGKKQALSSREYKKRFPLDHTFLPFVVSQKIHTFPFKVAKSMFFPFYREKKFLKTASLGAKIFSKFFFLWTFLKGEEVQGGKKGGCKEVPIRRVPI